ncbi:MAG: acyl-CoA dehydrogenase [Myxococcales bacterium]|nr:acyl-CoA dehydrogenase [Myxococcales bacterium]
MFEFSDEQKMAQTMLRQWCEKELAPSVAKMEKGEILPYDLMRKLGRTFGLDEMARGAFARLEAREARGEAAGLKSKEDEEDDGGPGGFARDPAISAIVGMELSRVCPGFTLAFGATLGLAGGAIMAKGTFAQKKRYALPILTLEKIGAWSMTEPNAGSDAFGGMRTVARRDGDGYVLNGQKTFITNAPFADVFVVYAKIVDDANPDPRTRPIHAFLLEKGHPGLSVSKPMDKMGMHSSPTGEVFLADVRIGREHLLGEKEKDPSKEGARDVFHGERTGMAPMCLGIVDRCLEDSLKYAKERTAWGRPIAEYQLMQDKLARMYMHRENIKNLLFKQLWMAKNGKRQSMAEASACKLYCARSTTEVALEAVQIMGGNGYMREYHVEMLMRDAKLLQIGGGTDEIQIVTIARALLA